VVGGFALVILVLLSLALVVGAAERASLLTPPSHAGFPHWMAGPLRGLWPSLTKSPTALKWDFSLTMGAMYLCYLLVLLCAHRLRVRWAIAAIVLLHAIYLMSPPLSLTDAFNYLNYGRMGFVHHLNPYTEIPVLEPHSDPAFAFSNWHHLVSPYGPLFTLFTYALAPLGLATGFWVLKSLLALTSLAALWLVWRCAELLGRDPLQALLFVGLNPLVLVWGLGGDHNDFFVVFWILLGFYLLLTARASRGQRPTASWATGNGVVAPAPAWRGSYASSAPTRTDWQAPLPAASSISQPEWNPASASELGAGGTLAPGAKPEPGGVSGGYPSQPGYPSQRGGPPQRGVPSAGPGPRWVPPEGAHAAWPPDVLTQRRLTEADSAHKARIIRESGAGVALVAAVAIKASAGILLPIVLLGAQRRLRLLAGMAAGGLVLGAATLYAFGPHLPQLADQTRLVASDSLPNVLGYSLGLGGETTALRDVLSVVLAVSVVACCVWAWRTRDWLLPATVAMLVLLLTLSWELPWYVYWLLPLAALVRSRALRGVTLVFGLYLLLAWIPLTTDLISGLNFRPTATPLGEQQSHLTKRLLH
jgi:hypothetical protein